MRSYPGYNLKLRDCAEYRCHVCKVNGNVSGMVLLSMMLSNIYFKCGLNIILFRIYENTHLIRPDSKHLHQIRMQTCQAGFDYCIVRLVKFIFERGSYFNLTSAL